MFEVNLYIRENLVQCFPHMDFTWAGRPSIFGETFLFLLLLLSLTLFFFFFIRPR